MENQTLIEQMLREVSQKIDTLFSKVNDIRLEASNHRLETTERVLEQTRAFDQKLLLLERRFDEKISVRSDKVDKWFDDMQEQFSRHKEDTTAKMTAVTVKVGVIAAGGSAILVALITALFRYVLSYG